MFKARLSKAQLHTQTHSLAHSLVHAHTLTQHLTPTTTRIHLALAASAAAVAGTYGLLTAIAVVALLALREIARRHVAPSPLSGPGAGPDPRRDSHDVTGHAGRSAARRSVERAHPAEARPRAA